MYNIADFDIHDPRGLCCARVCFEWRLGRSMRKECVENEVVCFVSIIGWKVEEVSENVFVDVWGGRRSGGC